MFIFLCFFFSLNVLNENHRSQLTTLTHLKIINRVKTIYSEELDILSLTSLSNLQALEIQFLSSRSLIGISPTLISLKIELFYDFNKLLLTNSLMSLRELDIGYLVYGQDLKDFVSLMSATPNLEVLRRLFLPDVSLLLFKSNQVTSSLSSLKKNKVLNLSTGYWNKLSHFTTSNKQTAPRLTSRILTLFLHLISIPSSSFIQRMSTTQQEQVDSKTIIGSLKELNIMSEMTISNEQDLEILISTLSIYQPQLDTLEFAKFVHLPGTLPLLLQQYPLPRLTSLICQHLSCDHLGVMAITNPHLQVLSIKGGLNVDMIPWNTLSEAGWKQSLIELDIGYTVPDLSMDLLYNIPSLFPNLIKLDISFLCPDLNNFPFFTLDLSSLTPGGCLKVKNDDKYIEKDSLAADLPLSTKLLDRLLTGLKYLKVFRWTNTTWCLPMLQLLANRASDPLLSLQYLSIGYVNYKAVNTILLPLTVRGIIIKIYRSRTSY